MDVFRLAERAMSMDEAAWIRHANPLSVWTRFTCLPLLVLAIWSRIWLGWWAVAPVSLALAWFWPNPRAFPRLAQPTTGRRRALSGSGHS